MCLMPSLLSRHRLSLFLPSPLFLSLSVFHQIYELTKIDRWFLYKLENIAMLKMALPKFTIKSIAEPAMLVLKSNGFSDVQIATGLSCTELEVRKYRKDAGITPFVKQVDTLAAEFPAATNYLYMTYSASEHDVEFDMHGIMVLGCGAYCIGSSVEFDWAAVSCVRTLRDAKKRSIVVNYNPETVSTDYDECDRLYFEELSFETQSLPSWYVRVLPIQHNFLAF